MGKIIAALALLAGLAMVVSSIYELWAINNTIQSTADLTVVVAIYAIAMLIFGVVFLISGIVLRTQRGR